MAPWNAFGSIPSLYVLWNSLRSIDVSSFVEVWKNSADAVTPSGHGLFFVVRLFITASISWPFIDLFKWFISCLFNFGRSFSSRNVYI
jgi:hypothetical protein